MRGSGSGSGLRGVCHGLKVSNTGYFVYCNGLTDRKAFDGKLDFEVTLIPSTGNDSWVEKSIKEAHECLGSKLPPLAGPNCDYCSYVGSVNTAQGKI